MNFPTIRSIAAVLLGCLLAAPASGATVYKVDDSTVTGAIVSLNAGKLVIEADTGSPRKQQTIPLTDIVQIVLRDPPPSQTAQSPGQANDNGGDNSQPSGGGLWSIFGHSPPPMQPNPGPGPINGPAGFGPPAATGAPVSPLVVAAPTTSRSAALMDWQITLTAGDALHAAIRSWSDQKMAITLDSPFGEKLDVPADQLAELWAGSDAEIARAKAIAADAADSDAVFVRKDGDVVPVKGQVLGIAGESLKFRFGDADRKIAMSRVVGIIMNRSDRKTPPAEFRQSVALHSGDTLIGKWTGVKRDLASLQTDWGQTIRVPLMEVDRIDFQNGRVIFVSDLKPAKVEQAPFFGRVIPYRVDCGLDGGPMKLSDGMYTHGIAVHTRCVLGYDIGGGFTRFRTTLGFEQPVGRIGRAAIRVLADGKPLYENPDARGEDKPVSIDVDITGVKTLTLEVDFGKGQGAGGRLIWANARLLRDMPGQ